MIDFAQEVHDSLAKLRVPEPRISGTLVRLVGLTLETRGIMAPLGACCEVLGKNGHRVEAEVVGFNDKTLYLMPFTDPVGVGPGDTVRVMTNSGQVRLGAGLIGWVAGETLVSDVALQHLIGHLAWLHWLVPALCAALVLSWPRIAAKFKPADPQEPTL